MSKTKSYQHFNIHFAIRIGLLKDLGSYSGNMQFKGRVNLDLCKQQTKEELRISITKVIN